MPRRKPPDPKLDALRQRSSLHPHPERVRDELFATIDFFDPRDLVQVKYEMLRRVRFDGEPISSVAAAFGFSRPSFYQAQAAFDRAGLVALVPRKPGPRGGHKLTADVIEFLQLALAGDPSVGSDELARLVLDQFGREVHTRTIERALQSQKKKRR